MLNNSNVFDLASNGIFEKKIPCVLIGGFALNFFKVTRQTNDVDFMIRKEDFDKIFNVFKKVGYTIAQLEEVFVRLKAPKPALMDIDFMFTDPETLARIIKEGKKVIIRRKTFIVPSLEHLVALKLHSIRHNQKMREFKDLPDIINLLRINKVKFKEKKFEAMCLKFGTKELYQKIVGSLEV